MWLVGRRLAAISIAVAVVSSGVLVLSGAPAAAVGSKVGPNGWLCFSVAGSPGDAALVNLTPVEADGPGDGQLISSDLATAPLAANVNYGTGTVDPNVAIAEIGTDGKVCYVNSKHTSVHLVADHLGNIAATDYMPATASGAPDRKVDTRIGLGGSIVGPSGRLCFAVAGSPGDAAIVNLTPVLAHGPGDGQLISSDVAVPPVAANVNFAPGTVDPNVAVAPIGADGQVCYVNSKHTSTHLVADHLGTITASAFQKATASGAPDRKADTRESSSNSLHGEQYLSIVEPLNCAGVVYGNTWDALVGVDGFFYDYEWPTLMDGLTTANAVLAAAYVRAIEQLVSQSWPTYVQSDIDDLVDELGLEANARNWFATAQTFDQWLQAEDHWNSLPLGSAATIIRAKLGLETNIGLVPQC